MTSRMVRWLENVARMETMRNYKRSLIRNPERNKSRNTWAKRRINFEKNMAGKWKLILSDREAEQFRYLGNTIINLLVPAVHKDTNFLIMQKYT